MHSHENHHFLRGALTQMRASLGAALSTQAVTVMMESGIPVHGIHLSHRVARAAWTYWRERHPQTGFYPFLAQAGPQWLAGAERRGGPWGKGGRDLLARALEKSPAHVMADIVESALQEALSYSCPPRSDDDLRHIAEVRELFDAGRLAATLPPSGKQSRPGTPRRAESRGGSLWLLLIEASAGYEVPALVPGVLQTANWSGFPDDRPLLPADHVAVLRHWHDLHGAEFYYADSAALELLVRHPPLDARAIAETAIEQHAYSPDFVHEPRWAAQGQVQTDVWSFWWD